MIVPTQPSPPPYYDPYDPALDTDPYPAWRQLRDEAPLYRNEAHGFYALSRYDDVRSASFDWQTYISGRGSVLEIVKSGVDIPPGTLIFEDPPTHDIHRGLLARVFTPRRIAALEPKVRAFCERTLDPYVGAGRLDFVKDLGAEVPMRTIGMMLGIPEADQVGHREAVDRRLAQPGGDDAPGEYGVFDPFSDGDRFGAYIDWRADHPSDDLMTALLHAEYEDAGGVTRRLTRNEISSYVALLVGAGNETTTRLIGWAGKVLAENPDQRAELVADPRLIPGAVEELLRYEAPSPVQARCLTRDVEWYRQTVPAGSVVLLVTGAANRDERRFENPDSFDIRRDVGTQLSFGYGVHFCLGSHLARLEARVALEEVLKRFPTWEVDWDRAVQAHTSTVRGWESLPVITTGR